MPGRITVEYDIDIPPDGKPDLVYLHEYYFDRVDICVEPYRTDGARGGPRDERLLHLPADCESAPLMYRLKIPATTYWWYGQPPITVIEKTWNP